MGLLPFLTAINTDVITVTVLLGLASTVLARGDSKQLARVGVNLSPAWALLAGFTYHVVRTRRASSTPSLPLVWVAALIATVYIAILLLPDIPLPVPPEVEP